MANKLWVSVGVLLIVLGFYLVIDSDVKQDPVTGDVISDLTNSVGFVGYAGEKSHDGSFDNFSLTYENGQIGGVIDASSVNTGIVGLDSHLKAEDFFNVVEYPEITFTGSVVEGNASLDITFLGETKKVVFPVNEDDKSLSGEFKIDAHSFGLGNDKVDSEVDLSFTVLK